jgi:hypothetical protein
VWDLDQRRIHALEAQMLATPDQQISLTDPDARSMATSGERSNRMPGALGHRGGGQLGQDLSGH